ncbi:hypothetical protein D6817_02485 [Candidatus Pacearchaeota archaeon]|nr:MAG: hypothetical protein D6817_02485 [Candidatus Pacearchaeota archaeon]
MEKFLRQIPRSVANLKMFFVQGASQTSRAGERCARLQLTRRRNFRNDKLRIYTKPKDSARKTRLTMRRERVFQRSAKEKT